MRGLTKGSVKALAIGIGSLMVSACGGHGPNTYLMSKDAVMAKLTGAQKDFSYGGPSKQSMQAVSVSGDTIKVRISSNGGGQTPPLCEAQVEAIDEEWTRVTPVCPQTDSAISNTVNEIYEKHVDEFVIAVLYDREVDSDMIRKRMGAVALDNMGEMRKEAISNAREFERLENGASDDGWRDSGSSW